MFETPVPQAPRRRWLPRVVAVAVLVGAVVVLARLDLFGGSEEATRPAAQAPASVEQQLKERMTATLEGMPADQHDHGGHTVGQNAGKMVCAVRVYGYEPEQAATVADVKVVYGFHMCAAPEPGMPWDWAPKSVSPLMMRLDTQPPATTMVKWSEGKSYQQSLKEIIPPRYQQVAAEGALEPGGMEALKRRFEAAVAALPSPAPPSAPAASAPAPSPAQR